MDNKLGMQMFDGGYVHHGLLKAAKFILERETETLRDLLRRYGPEYKLVLTGHSLGSGIAALMTVLVVNNRKEFDNIPRSRVKCYALAPARCMSLNLAVKYADVINSVVLQVRPYGGTRLTFYIRAVVAPCIRMLPWTSPDVDLLPFMNNCPVGMVCGEGRGEGDRFDQMCFACCLIRNVFQR